MVAGVKKGVALAVTAGLMLTACGAPARRAAPPAEPPALAPALPLPDNAVADAIGRLDGIANDVMASTGIPGMAVAVVHGGRTLYAEGFGVRDTRRPLLKAPGSLSRSSGHTRPK